MKKKKSPLRISFVAAEVAPYAKVGGLADVVGSLPKALADLGCLPRVIVPRYEHIRLADMGAEQVAVFSIPFAGQSYNAKIYRSQLLHARVPLYLIDQPIWLSSGDIYRQKDSVSDSSFLLKRFLFFCLAAQTLITKLRFAPHIVHVHDWMTAPLCLLPDPTGRNANGSKRVLTIHNIGNEGFANAELLNLVGLTLRSFSPLTRSKDDHHFFNTFAQAILEADCINTVSPTYAKEILTSKFGGGLERVLKKRARNLRGILNGIDTEYFNPASDQFIAEPFTQDSLKRKPANKRDLQKNLGLRVSDPAFLCGIVTRLSEQKGIELLIHAMKHPVSKDMQFAILGEGNAEYEEILRSLSHDHSGQIAFSARYDSHLARKIYAGADAFLMPSRYEPCGLAQLIALRYGTVPIVHDTGGLHDTVVDFRKRNGQGFLFKGFAPKEFLKDLDAARREFLVPQRWQRLQLNGMSADHSWQRSAQEYLQMYQSIVAK